MAEKPEKIRVKPAVVVDSGAEIVMLGKSQPSVLLKLDGKGVKTYEIKVYADDVEEAGKLARLEAKKVEARWVNKTTPPPEEE